MDREKILNKAIERAIENGFDIQDKGITSYLIDNDVYTVIFSHEFAKAFWGEENLFSYSIPYGEYAGDTEIMKEYEYHLQQMVLEEDPILYLEKFI